MTKLLLPALLGLCSLPLFAFTQSPFVTQWTPPPAHTSIPALTLRISAADSTKTYNNIVLEWNLLVNGVIKQKGKTIPFTIPLKHPATLRLPIKIPTGDGEEAFLNIIYHKGKDSALQAEQLPLRSPVNRDLSVHPVGELTFHDTLDSFTIESPSIHLQFNKQTGWLQQYEVNGSGWLTSPPGQGLQSSFIGKNAAPSAWDSAEPHLQLFSTSTGSQIVIVRAEYSIPETACLLHLSYTVNALGEIRVEETLEPDSTHQQDSPPRLSMHGLIGQAIDTISWYGQTQQHIGITHEAMPVDSIGAQEVRWWSITTRDGRGFQITADSMLLTIATRATPAGYQISIDRPASYQYIYKITPIQPPPARHQGK